MNENERIVDAVPARPFYKRTEFYLTVVALIFGALVASGAFGVESIALKLFSMGVAVLASLGYTVGAAIAKVPLPTGTPGWKTSEFWIVVATSGLNALQSIDVLPQTEGGGVLAALLTGAPAGAYAIARGKVKAGGAAVLIVALAGSGCSSWASNSRTALHAVYAGAKTASTTGGKLIGDECRAAALTCQRDRRAAELARDEVGRANALTCEPLKTCHAKLHTFNSVCIDILLGVADGLALVDLGEAAASKQVQSIIDKVKNLLSVAQTTIAEARR